MTNRQSLRMLLTVLLAVAPVLGGAVDGQLAAPPSPPPADSKATRPSLLEQVLRILGVSIKPPPPLLPGPPRPGELWLTDVTASARNGGQRLTTGEDYRSPIFTAAGDRVLAMSGDALVEIPLSTRAAHTMRRLPTVEKLVGADASDFERILVVVEDPRGPSVAAFLTLATGSIQTIPEVRSVPYLLEHLRAWQREYGDIVVYPDRDKTIDVLGNAEWSNVFWRRGDGEAVPVTSCRGADCWQPSLSPDSRTVVYVRTPPD